VPALAAFRQPDSLPESLPLHGWIADSMRTVLDATPEAEQHLPSTASSFIHHFAAASSSVSSSLQRTLSSLASKHQHNASLSAARGKRGTDGGVALAHAIAISAPRACAWKTVVPATKELHLSDEQYKLAARLNLGLPPMPPGALPDACPSCKKHTSLAVDPWHFLTCAKESKGEVYTRHNDVADAIYHTVLAVGGQAFREPVGLEARDGRRPDLQLVVNLQNIICDVVVSHPLNAGYIRDGRALRPVGVAMMRQRGKHDKYDHTAAQHHAQMLAFSVETCGGMAPDAVTLLHTIAEAAEQKLGLWPHGDVLRHLLDTVSIAVQRGNSMTFLAGYSRAMTSRRDADQEE